MFRRSKRRRLKFVNHCEGSIDVGVATFSNCLQSMRPCSILSVFFTLGIGIHNENQIETAARKLSLKKQAYTRKVKVRVQRI